MDLAVILKGSGGDLLQSGSDLAINYGNESAPTMQMFGGNNWWANEFLEPDQQFASLTEDALSKYPLTSTGRLEIEKAINADLAIITVNVPGTTTGVTTTIVSDIRMDIDISINGQNFYYTWNPSVKELTNRI